MKRRRLIALGAALAAPFTALAQQSGRMYRLGMVTSTVRAEWARIAPYNFALIERLSELGFVEGRNLVIELRAHEGKSDRLPDFAAELARLNCDVLIAAGNEPILVSLKQATRDTPIVALAIDYDHFSAGHVASLARPGGRITGITHLQDELPAKRVELLKELLPRASKIAVLADHSNAGQLAVAQAGAKRVGVELLVLMFEQQPYDYEAAFAQATREKAQGLLALGAGNFVPARRRITDLALSHRLPSMFHHSVWVEFGGLLSYGPNFAATLRRAAEQVAMIFNGKKPADMPVEQPTRFELVINMRTAKALGVTIPQSLLLRAERVIE